MTVRTQVFDFPGAQGQRLSGRLDLPDGAAAAHAVLAHCFTCGKNAVVAVRIARALAARGIGVLRFDFTGLGQSSGDFSDAAFSGNVADLIAAVRAMEKEGCPPKTLIGHSLGGTAALAAAGRLPDIAVVTIGAPFDPEHVTHLFDRSLGRILEEGEARVRLGGKAFTIRREFIEDLRDQDQGHRSAHLGRPLLILHSPNDEVVGIDNAAAIFDAARHPKSFVSLGPADHLLTKAVDSEYAATMIAAWMTRFVPGVDSTSVGPGGTQMCA
jgi:putative redox protein